MTKKICIVGSPSCRKSTVAVTLESKLKQMGFNADVAEEYARTYIQRYGVPFSPFQQFLIYEKQMRREADILNTNPDFMLTDTAPWLGAIYVKLLIDATKDEANARAYNHCYSEILKKAIDNILTYDYIFFFPVQEKVVQDGVRTQTDEERYKIEKAIQGFLDFTETKYYTVKGTVEGKAQYILDRILPKPEHLMSAPIVGGN